MNDAEQLARAIRSSHELLVVSGAGISLASGLPTFRGSDPGAVWARDVTELGTLRYFSKHPVDSWRWYLARFEKMLQVEPNAAHGALVSLEHWQQERGGFLLVTQNIDVLHRRAGSRALVEVHGRADRVRCASAGCDLGAPHGSLPRADLNLQPFLDAPGPSSLPRCPSCGDLLRPHILWFDELYQGHDDYQWVRVQERASSADLVLFVGTSLSVGVTEFVLQQALGRDQPVVLIDPAAASCQVPLTLRVSARAEEILPQVMGLLRAG